MEKSVPQNFTLKQIIRKWNNASKSAWDMGNGNEMDLINKKCTCKGS